MYKIAVITPYYKEPIAMLRQTHDSVMGQALACDHIMIADGHPQKEIASWNAKHIVLADSHADNGNTPRGIGSNRARVDGYDFISYLDADNWFEPGHLQSLVNLYEETKAPVCTSFRNFYAMDDTPLNISEQDEERLVHVDTSCYLIHSSAFHLTDIWLKMPKPLAPLCDRVFFSFIKSQKNTIKSTAQRTVNFRSQYEVHYQAAKKTIPENVKTPEEFSAGLDFLKSPDGVKECKEIMNFWPLPYLLRRQGTTS
jgi:glycosyltransferase involved in cell wall biosynthesis